MPEQDKPFLKGAGSVQVRVLLKREPDVQLTKPPQVDQVDQTDHPPSTESRAVED